MITLMQPRSTRRSFLGTATKLIGIPVAWTSGGFASSGATKSKSGRSKPKKVSVAEAFDPTVETFMREREIPGGALAIVRHRKLIYARGYGWADREAKQPAKETSLFRVASLSKPITALAVLQLVERGKLKLDGRMLPLMERIPGLTKPELKDSRWSKITIEQLLQHTGGWDRDAAFDPMFRARRIAAALEVPSPPQPREIIRYMRGEPLEFDPGTKYAYSNFGYSILGRIIEELSGTSYEEFVRKNILRRVGAAGMRLGKSLPGDRAKNEVRYYMPKATLTASVFGERGGPEVPFPYGGFCLEAMDAHGGWLASAVDLAKITAALAVPERCPFLRAHSLDRMYQPPPAPAWRSKEGQLQAAFYGCGWMVRPNQFQGKANYWHTGSLPGTSTLWVRRGDGLSWVVFFNQRSNDPDKPDSAIDPALHQAAARVTDWG